MTTFQVHRTGLKVIIIVGLCCVLWLPAGLCLAGDDAQTEGRWVPTVKDISEVERKVRMPKGAAPLKTFTREYTGRIERGHRMIVGVYSGSSGEVVIAKSEQELYSAFDGGCSIVEVKYDLTSHRVIDAFCHGEA
jgi:hypothetical protein